MSSCVDVVSDQLRYIPCNFCNIVLAVSVPCNSLFETVTVRCGHCSNLWSVNMAAQYSSQPAPPFSIPIPRHDSYPRHHPYHQPNGYNCNPGSSSRHYHSKIGMKSAAAAAAKPVVEERIVNRPPEKKQRVPSAYNQFIKEEIQRIKSNNPEMTHREAFSTAAKNWAHFPHIHFGLMLETNTHPKLIQSVLGP